MKLISTLILLSSLLLFSSALACESDQITLDQIRGNENNLVRGPYTIEQLEKSNLITIRESGVELPFGYVNTQWEELKSLKRPSDEIFFIRTSESRDEGRDFQEGYVLVANGCVVYTLTMEVWYEGKST